MFHLWLRVNILFNGIQQYFRVIWSGGGYDLRTEWERTETDTDIRYSAKISTFKERWKIRIFSTFLIGDLFTTLFYVCSMLKKIDIFGIKTARSWERMHFVNENFVHIICACVCSAAAHRRIKIFYIITCVEQHTQTICTLPHAHRTIDIKIIEIDIYAAVQCVPERKGKKVNTTRSVND